MAIDRPYPLLAMMLTLSACSPLDNPWDPQTCDEGCEGICYKAECIATGDLHQGGVARIGAGTFEMGANYAVYGCTDLAEAFPPHQVTLTRSFEIDVTEVTLARFFKLMDYTTSVYPYCPGSGNCELSHQQKIDVLDTPAEGSWHEAVAYCNALSEHEGLERCYACSGQDRSVVCSVAERFAKQAIYGCPGYRLPTEAEWEMVTSNGTLSAKGTLDPCNNDDPVLDAIAWYEKNSNNQLHPVARKEPNSAGIYDLLGNVAEWIHDGSTPPNHSVSPRTDPVEDLESLPTAWAVVRGGSFNHERKWMLPQARDSQPARGENRVGFRCVRTVSAD